MTGIANVVQLHGGDQLRVGSLLFKMVIWQVTAYSLKIGYFEKIRLRYDG